MAPKKYTAEQMQSPYLWFVDILALYPSMTGVREVPFIRINTQSNGNYKVEKIYPMEETAKILNDLELFYPPYGSKYTPAEAAEFINLVTANHPRLRAKATYTEYYDHLKWMKEHKAPAIKTMRKSTTTKQGNKRY